MEPLEYTFSDTDSNNDPLQTWEDVDDMPDRDVDDEYED